MVCFRLLKHATLTATKLNKKLGGVHFSHLEVVIIILVALCYRNRVRSNPFTDHVVYFDPNAL